MIARMGAADSPLRDRVIFVQGAPRSGTTWLVMLLATHPQIAGVEAESHLFEYGVEHLFANFEGRDPSMRGLRTYLEGDRLVDLIRVDACDARLDTAGALSQERFSELGAVVEHGAATRFIHGARRAKQVTCKTVDRLRRGGDNRTADLLADLSFDFTRALHERDDGAIRSMTADSTVLTFRSPDGDVCVRGNEARDELVRIGSALFDVRHISEWWASAEGGPREWWTRASGQPFWTVFFWGIAGDATRSASRSG
jgi:hypothetical protein